MPLLAFKYLPLRGARLEKLQIDWAKKEVSFSAEILTDGRVGRATVQFADVRALKIELDSGRPDSAIIESCKEEAGTFRVSTEAGEVSVTATRYSVT